MREDPYGWILVLVSCGLFVAALALSGCSSSRERRADCVTDCGRDLPVYNPAVGQSPQCLCFVVPE